MILVPLAQNTADIGVLALSIDGAGAIGSKYSRHWWPWLKIHMMLVSLAQYTADNCKIGSGYRWCWCYWLNIQPILVSLALGIADVGAIGWKYSRYWWDWLGVKINLRGIKCGYLTFYLKIKNLFWLDFSKSHLKAVRPRPYYILGKKLDFHI